MRTVSALWLAAVVLVMTAGVPGHAQTKIWTVPISRDLLNFRLVFNGDPVQLTTQNGGLARIATQDGGAFALVPQIRDGGATVGIFEITTDPVTKAEGMQWLSKMQLTPGLAVQTTLGTSDLEIELVGITARPSTTPPADGPCQTCCVVCGGQTYCGCRVITECGSCCCPDACDCSGAPPSASCATPLTAVTRR